MRCNADLMIRQLAQGHSRPPRLRQTSPKQYEDQCQHEEKTPQNMKQSKRSPVRQYFELKTDKEAKWNIYDVVLKYSNSTSSLMYHVKSTHPPVSTGMQQLPAVLAKRKNVGWGMNGGHYPEDQQHGCKRYDAEKHDG